MSDEDRDEREDGGRREGESVREWMQRLASPERQLVDLFQRLTARVEASESRLGTHEEESRRRAEETQRKMDFIVEQQAQFTADMQRLQEAQAESDRKWEQRWERVEGMWTNTEKSVRGLLSIAEIHQQEIGALRESQAQTDKQMRETDERLKETNERLDALINTVERVISERRNGGKGEG